MPELPAPQTPVLGDDVHLTPEMMQAGRAAVARAREIGHEGDDLIASMYRAMNAAAPPAVSAGRVSEFAMETIYNAREVISLLRTYESRAVEHLSYLVEHC